MVTHLQRSPGRFLVISLCVIQFSARTVKPSEGAIQASSLEREALLALDNDVSNYYKDSYDDLDRRNVSFSDQLYKAIRSVRHTNVVHHHDFMYTSEETKLKSMGARIDQDLCRRQLRVLTSIAKASSSGLDVTLPLSVIDFFSSSGQVGSGVLNGNFFWPGSHATCTRATIPTSVLDQFEVGDSPPLQEDIKGRYCVAHLRAKDWPKLDRYFGDRITLKRGICLPDSCHTAVYEADEKVQRDVAHLALSHLIAPFTSEHFELQTLYCLPDEDSEFRRLDLGAKLFIGFISLWLLLTVYVNLKYYQRLDTLRQLLETVDIRMIINEKRDSDKGGVGGDDDEGKAQDEERVGKSDGGPLELDLKKLIALDGTAEASCSELEEEDLLLQPKPETPSKSDSTLKLRQQIIGCHLGAGPSAATSSRTTTPFSSEIEGNGNDVEQFANAKAPGKRKRNEAETRAISGHKKGRAGLFDLVEALSIERNLKFLFYKGRDTKTASARLRSQDKSVESRGASRSSGVTGDQLVARSSPPQLASVTRRSSSSNEALIKDLAPGSNAKVAIVTAANERPGHNLDSELDGGTRERRVNIEILDGFKVIATCWIVHGHTMMFFFGCVTDLRFGVERMFDVTMIATINTLQIVGLFYIITGCLLTYFSFSKSKKKQLLKPSFWLLVLVGRYLRLMPTYALVFWFARHVAPHTGSGRDWPDYRTDIEHPRGYCGQESWWVMWTMSTADVKIPMDCVPQAWYLSNDFRTLLVLPVYVCLLARNVILGYAAIVATFAYSTLKVVRILRLVMIDYKVMLLWQPHVYSIMADRLHEVYTDFSVRMSTYLLGVIVGHLLYLYETRTIRAWPRWFRRFGIKISLCLALLIFFGACLMASPTVNQFLPDRDQLTSDAVVWLIPIFKNSMEVCMCVIVLLIVTGAGFKWFRRAMSSQAMKVLSNISYAVFLTHIEIMYKLPIAQFESTYWTLFLYSTFFILLAQVVSFFVYLLWEMPINNLTRNMFKRAFQAISD